MTPFQSVRNYPGELQGHPTTQLGRPREQEAAVEKQTKGKSPGRQAEGSHLVPPRHSPSSLEPRQRAAQRTAMVRTWHSGIVGQLLDAPNSQTIKSCGVPTVARSLTLLSRLKTPELWCRSQMWVRFCVTVAMAGSCSSDLTPSLGIYIGLKT